MAKALWAKLGIGEPIQARLDQQQLPAPRAAALLAMAAQRLDRPGSKPACHERWLDRAWLPETRDLGLHQLRRALNVLALHGDAVEQAVSWRAVDLFRLDVDLAFHDGTTTRFACDGADVASHAWRGLAFEPLRRRGHGREGRDNDPQVVIALAVTRDGVPVRSWVFPGSTPALRAEEVAPGRGERGRRCILCLNEEEADGQRWHRAEVLKLLSEDEGHRP